MNKFLIIVIVCFFSKSIFAQTEKQKEELKTFANFLKIEDDRNYKKAIQLAVVKGWPLQLKLTNGGIAKLTGVSFNGMPEYTATESNVGAANTTGASSLWNGGSTGLNLTGSSTALNGKIAVWDGGAVLGSHQELTGRILSGDNAASLSDHATHVTGTIMAKGINANAKGMLYNINNITTFDFNSDNSEMATNANNFILSNHSYGSIAGWRYNGTVWEFHGEHDATEDYKFGFYDSKSRYWDSIAFLSPNYLMVKSAGNKRSENGPNTGQNFRRFNAQNQMVDAGAYTGNLSANNSYDIIPTYGNAKNILTVGAVGILNNGFSNAAQVQMSSFSSWGPTDDGRIKPELVAAGVDMYSSIATGNASYDILSGTSMSSPNATGSLGLIQELYRNETNNFMKSATLKALAIQTTDEAGDADGPDYKFGYGLLNVKKASVVIKERNTKHRILENTLNQGATFSQNYISSGGEKLLATIAWTDPAATVTTVNYLNNRTKKLINDLDLRIVSSSGTIMPWKLDYNNPSFAAVKADNDLDNNERVEILNPIPGETYEVRISHKNALLNGSQNYSLIVSGVGGTAYCVSQPNSNSDSRIDLFNFAGINRVGSGCTQYTNATALFASVYPLQVVPFSITLGTCGAHFNKMAKLFIDWNGDGDFDDANELIATSAVIATTGIFSGNVNVPSNVATGFSTRLRIVVSETTDPSTILPCGTYAKGETLDASIKIVAPVNDTRATAVILPVNGDCASDNAFVQTTIQNIGTAIQSNVPIKALIYDGATLVSTLLDTLKSSISASDFKTVLFRNTFVTTAGKTYTFKVFTDLGSDLIKSNDTVIVTKTIAPATTPSITNTSGQVCTANQAILSAANTNGQLFWYTQPNGGTPIANGNNVTVSTIPNDRTYYIGVNDAKGAVGPTNKNVLGNSGGYAAFSNVQNIATFSPVLIENLRMYIGSSGTVEVYIKETSTGSIVASSSFDVSATTSTPGTGVNDLNDNGIVLPVNLKIPNSGLYQMGCNFSNGATAFRHNGLATNPYPFTLPQLMEITSSNLGTGLTAYYWFYDLKVKSLGCAASVARTTLVANAMLTPTISQSANTVTVSEQGTVYSWSRDGSPVPNSNSQTINLIGSGNYVCTVLKGGCAFTSPAFNATFTSINNINPNKIGLTITPNPVKDKANITFNLSTRENVSVSIISMQGKKLNSFNYIIDGNTTVNKTIDVSNYPSGSYLLRINYKNNQVTKKMVIE
jgi:hypothetical protein